MKNIIALLILAAAFRQCSSFVPSHASLPKVVTTSAEREHKFRAKRKISTEEDDGSSSRQGDAVISSVDGDQNSSDNVPKQTTLSGGTPLILDMARRMLVWDDELYQGLNDASPSSEPSPSAAAPTQAAAANAAAVAALPRWRPKSITQQSISNANPSFRTSSPIMTNAGYASILKRNSRKKNKPSMWRHCLRVYDKMGELEKERRTDKRGKRIKVKRSTAHHEAALVAASKLGLWEEALSIYKRVEKASLASKNNVAATSNADGGSVMKLRSKNIRITDNMVLSVVKASVKASRIKKTTTKAPIYLDSVNDAEQPSSPEEAMSNTTALNATMYDESADSVPPVQPTTSARPSLTLRLLTTQERREPLDFARDVVLSMEEKHDIPLVSRHVNPLASAYLHLGLRSEAANLINSLNDRRPPPPDVYVYPKKFMKEKSELTSPGRFSEGVQIVNWEDDDLDDVEDSGNDEEEFGYGYESPQLNIHDVQSKDRGSYSLLVKGAVIDEDWVGAVGELQRMNDAGLHPNSSNLNSWSEVMEKGCRPAGKGEVMDDNYYSNRQRRRSWRKRRDGIWLGNIR
mmetsp:Transcript_13821/g.23480  ORF Transcript_13821/g.23480 Transcript_13821/m.23480 type:complete len:575 (-) Transcript_13821:41-1765(-)